MEDLFWVFERMPRQGIGSRATTLQALSRLGIVPGTREAPLHALDLGAGSGEASLTLASRMGAEVVAVELHERFLAALRERAAQAGVDHLIEAWPGDMATPPERPGGYDLIIAEGSAYLLGFEEALRRWKPLLRPGGALVISELVRVADPLSPPMAAFWGAHYPDLATADVRRAQCEAAGYERVDDFQIPESDWEAFYEAMESVLVEARRRRGESAVLQALQREADLYRAHAGEVGYQVYCLRRPVSVSSQGA